MNKKIKIDFLGIGAKKTATTWVYKCLSEHPDIRVSQPKELNFFSNNELFAKGIESYQKFFPDYDKNKINGEFSVNYLANRKAPERIKKLFPEIKLIVVLRNPIDRAYSDYLHIKSKGRISDNTNLKESLKKYPEIIENGMYAKCLENYLNYFDRKKILILFYDDLLRNPKDFIKKLFEFLEVDTSFVPEMINKKYHTSKARSSIFYRRINFCYNKLQGSFWGDILINIVKFIGLNANSLEKINSFLGKKKKDMDFETRSFLNKVYCEDIKKLEKLLDKRLSSWK